MRLVTFNILSGRRCGEERADLDRYAAAIRSLDADVLALQEVDRGQDRSRRADLTAIAAEAMRATHYRFAPALVGTPGDTWRAAGAEDRNASPAYGIALLSRYPVTDWRVLRLDPVPGRAPVRWPGQVRPTLVRDEPRVAIAATVHAPAGPFTVVCTHLTFLRWWNRRQLGRLVGAFDALPRPLVLMGDLNMGPERAASLTGLRALASHLTFPADVPREQIDHVLTDGGLTVRASAARRLAMSDHRALVVDVSP